jgi:hypothetical protein
VEIPLEHREVCNVCETLPTMCYINGEFDFPTWQRACEYATLYMTTVSLLPTHQHSTNRVVARNRRIGGSIVDYSGWKHNYGVHKVTKWMRQGYKKVCKTAKWSNNEAGVPEPIRHTTIKPGGTGPKLPGKTPGIGNPNFDYMIRRVRVAKNSPVHALLVEANVPYEEDYFDKYTDVFEWPIIQGPAPPAEKVSLWEQAMNLVLVQREWADNAVSNTLNFRPMWPVIEKIDIAEDFEARLTHYLGTVTAHLLCMGDQEEYLVPERYKIRFKRSIDGTIFEIYVHEFDPAHEEHHIEPVLSAIAPVTKSVTLLPHSAKGAYRQMPEEGISRQEYERRRSEIRTIDWSKLSGSDGLDEQYCTSEHCEIPR